MTQEVESDLKKIEAAIQKAIIRALESCGVASPDVVGVGGSSRGASHGKKTDLDYHLCHEAAYTLCLTADGWSKIAAAMVRETKAALAYTYARFVFNHRWLNFVYDNVTDRVLKRPEEPDYYLFIVLPDPIEIEGSNTTTHFIQQINEVDLCIGKSMLFKRSGITYSYWFKEQAHMRSAADTISEVKNKLRRNKLYKSRGAPVQYGISIDSLVWQAGVAGIDFDLPDPKESKPFVRHTAPSIELLVKRLQTHLIKAKPHGGKDVDIWHICYLLGDDPLLVQMFPDMNRGQLENIIQCLKSSK